MPLQLHFETDPSWIVVIRKWAREEGIASVWLFGSRASGHRRPKPDQQEEPDLDLAYTLHTQGGDALGTAICMNTGWRGRLQAQIPVIVDLQYAADDNEVVMPAVKADGMLIYSAEDAESDGSAV